MQNKPKDICCPKFDPTPWDKKEITWQNKLFIKETLPIFFHVPFPPMIGKMMTRMWKKIEEANASPEMKDFLWLSTDISPWKNENFIHVTKKVPNAANTTISGTFITKVFDGPFNAAPKWMKETQKYVESLSKQAQKYYFYYTTCPKCAKKYGHNYVVVFAQVA
jgi:hypothetical protein